MLQKCFKLRVQSFEVTTTSIKRGLAIRRRIAEKVRYCWQHKVYSIVRGLLLFEAIKRNLNHVINLDCLLLQFPCNT